MIESLVQNKQNYWIKFKGVIKNNIIYQIIIWMLVYWFLGNIILFSLFNIFSSPWKIISGFNLGFVGSLIGFLILNLSSHWLFSKTPFKQVLVYFIFLFRIVIYGTIIGLVIYFKFINLFSVIGGLSILMVATLTSEFLFFIKTRKEKKKC
ncbi:MAG: hypothetical protein ACRC8P_02860 [Spiroplasma sp.]